MKAIVVRCAVICLVSSALPFPELAYGGSFGPVVSWNRIEGTIILPDESAMRVGPNFAASLRLRDGGDGNAFLYLSSGYFFLNVRGLSWGSHYDNGPLGAGMTGTFVATVVCDSVPAATATYQSVDTPKFEVNQGNAFFIGILALPQSCKDEPNEIVLLLRHDPDMANANLAGKFIAYGAGRTVR